MTALGPIDVRRSHGYCEACSLPGFPADGLIGIGGRMTARAAGMACLAGVNDPFRKAQTLLEGLCGWSVCAEVIRQGCHEHASDARERRDELSALPQAFAQYVRAPGYDRELQIDAGKVNTPDGWRDVKLAVFACRERGDCSTSLDYEQRDLPGVTVRSVVAQVQEARDFGKRCKAEAGRLGFSDEGLSILGDGAEWIWNLASEQFPGASCLLDVYHGVEKLAEAGREAFGAGTGQMSGWLDEARGKLVADGYAGVCEVLAGPIEDEQARARMDGKAPEVLNYFCGQRDRLNYAARLSRGQAIGSGLVEGTIKQRVNARMKRGSARWLAEHVGPFVEFLAMSETPEWSEYWSLMAA